MRSDSPTLTLGYSPCPNDCFIFYALAHGKVDAGSQLAVRLEDVETLNHMAAGGELDIAKVSYHAFGHLADRYIMLGSGGALGRGVGPLVVTRNRLDSLSGRKVAMPGGWTTANLLLRLWGPDDMVVEEMRYDRILPAVAEGQVDAGLIIHESRFTFGSYGLQRHIDLGEWWERETGHLLPLGGIAARRELGGATLRKLERAVRQSLEYAYAHPDEVEPYLAANSQEIDPDVRRRHIELYVNGYSLELGDEGRAAVRELFRRAEDRGFLSPPGEALFLEAAAV